MDSDGAETADKCAWIGVGGTGGARDVTFATGTFAMQGTWANDASACEISHPTDGQSSGTTLTVTTPASQTTAVGARTRLAIHATGSAGQALAYSATGLPPGLAIDPKSGVISGTVKSPCHRTVTVAVSATGGARATTSFKWTVLQTSVVNGSFATGTLAAWAKTGTALANSVVGHGDTHEAIVGATTGSKGDSALSQTFVAAAGNSALSLYFQVTCSRVGSHNGATVWLRDFTVPKAVELVATQCSAGKGWQHVTASVVAGHRYTITLASHDSGDTRHPTFTEYDDIALR